MNPLLEVLCNEINKLKKALTTTGSDYTATVTKVEGDTAYVQIAGSDISDTPVALSVNAAEGDHVRVRVANGKAWITGNDTLPPSNDKKEVGTKMMKNMSDRDDDIIIDFGKMEFIGNTLIVDSKNFKLDEDGNAKFSGTLEAAGGSFSGVVSFIAKDPGNVKHDVQIGPNTSGGAPIHIQTMFLDDTVRWLNISDTEIRFYFEPENSNDYSYHEMDAFGTQMEGWTSTDATHGYLETMQMNKSNLYYSRSGQGSCTFDYLGPHPSSDIRLKEDITKIDPETAKHMMPVQFRFKGGNKLHYGFIAQDVQKVIPDTVQEDEDGYLSLTYHELIAPLYALVQEQEDRINRLEAQLKALEDKK